MMNAIGALPANIKNKVVGVVLFGYTKNGQTKGSIPGYPKENVKVFCSAGDGVCGGALLVSAGHFSYMMDGSGPKAVTFLLSKINGAGSSGGGGRASSGLGKGGKGGKLGKFGKGGKRGFVEVENNSIDVEEEAEKEVEKEA